MSKRLLIGVATAFLTIFAACEKVEEPDRTSDLRFAFSLKPAIDAGFDVTEVRAIISKSSYIDSLTMQVSGDSAIGYFPSLEPGIYEIQIKMFQDSFLVAGGSGIGAVYAGQNTVVSITLHFLTGSLTINVDWETGETNDLVTGLVAHFPFNGDASDLSSLGNHGTVYNATLTEDRFGNPSAAYAFNGENAYIEIPDDFSLNPLNAITFCAWVNLNDLNKVGSIVRKGNDQSKGNYSLIFAPGYNMEASIRFVEDAYPNPVTGFYSTSSLPTALTWHFLAITYDGLSMKYYFDGTLDSSITVSKTMSSNSGILSIGMNPTPGYEQWFDGKIDDVRIYNRALNTNEIHALYELTE